VEEAMSFLPLLADAEQIEFVRQVCRDGRAMIRRGLTERYLDQVWQVSRTRLGIAVYEHIELKRKVFGKLDVDGKRISGKMHANVTLAEDLDVYVEIELRGEEVVILAAHSHTPGVRLPQ
jgi:hypothetical protein